MQTAEDVTKCRVELTVYSCLDPYLMETLVLLALQFHCAFFQFFFCFLEIFKEENLNLPGRLTEKKNNL